ncbi:flavin reductase family protein [Deinococcus arenicola]|uniref:Flavin reductase family protein n=1 Tax=Deinococcus arenicola TaxID=2994950 RepID=A0ABU4DR83_9DEIO|nr:flavin reductase family protein [Deinococcus sp. ZS9-10]MDV6374940.1 flavin reductase family protein [Deinococcus sp. ZS9-10]
MLSETGTQFFGYYPGTVALVTAEHDGICNVMAAGWHTALSAQPPLYGVLVGRERVTHPLISESGVFGVNFLPAARAREVQGTGVLSLHDLPEKDKFARLGLETLPGAPLALADAYLHYHCRVIQTVPTGDHDLFVGEVMEVRHDPAFYDERRLFTGEAAVYLGRSSYVKTTQEREIYPPESFE